MEVMDSIETIRGTSNDDVLYNLVIESIMTKGKKMRKYTIVLKGKTLYYPTMDEAIKMARFVGFPVSMIKEVDLF